MLCDVRNLDLQTMHVTQDPEERPMNFDELGWLFLMEQVFLESWSFEVMLNHCQLNLDVEP